MPTRVSSDEAEAMARRAAGLEGGPVTATPEADASSLKREIAELSARIHSTMHEVASIRHPFMMDDRVAGAVDELDAIVAAAEMATGEILGAAEVIDEISEKLSGSSDPEAVAAGEALQELTVKIFEASNFQDITGQRTTKVATLLREIDVRLLAMIEHMGEEAFAEVPVPETPEGDASLLNGPALTDGLQQDAIDSLFD